MLNPPIDGINSGVANAATRAAHLRWFSPALAVALGVAVTRADSRRCRGANAACVLPARNNPQNSNQGLNRGYGQTPAEFDLPRIVPKYWPAR